MPSSNILHLPISLCGFGFASISHFNDAAAVSRVLWDLNHHVPLFHNMAQCQDLHQALVSSSGELDQ